MELYEVIFYILILLAIICVMLRIFSTIHNNKNNSRYNLK